MSFDNLIFLFQGGKLGTGTLKYIVLSSKVCQDSDDARKLLAAVNIAKPQPRRTTRDKYKQEAGYRPVMNQVVKRPDLAFHKNDIVPYKSGDGAVQYLLMTSDIRQTDFVRQQAIAGKTLEPSVEGFENDYVFEIKARKRASAVGSNLIVDPSTGDFLVYPGKPENGEVCVSRDFFNQLLHILERLENVEDSF